MGGKIRRREIALPYDPRNQSAEYSISMYDARAGVPSDSTNQTVLPFSAPTPFGVTIRKL